MSSRSSTAPPTPGLNDRPESTRPCDSSGTSPSIRPLLTTGIVVSIEGRLYREGLVALLSTQADLRVLGSTETCSGTIALCSAHRPQVLVLGSNVAWSHDFSPYAAIRMASPATGILVLAPHGTDRCSLLNPHVPAMIDESGPRWMGRSTCLQDATVRGALAALDGDTDPATLFDALRSVARGERWGAGPPAKGNGNGHGNRHSTGNGTASRHGNDRGNGQALSPQELKVARLVGRGASNKEIAASLAISELTVKKHVGSILQKLGLNDRLQLGLCVARNPMSFMGDGARD